MDAVSGTATLDIHDLNDAVRKNGVRFYLGIQIPDFHSGRILAEFRADGSGKGEFGGVMKVLTRKMEKRVAQRKWEEKDKEEMLVLSGLKVPMKLFCWDVFMRTKVAILKLFPAVKKPLAWL